MKKLVYLLVVLFTMQSFVLSAPYSIDLSNEPSYVIDGSYNLELRKNLEDKFHEKYCTKTVKTQNSITTYCYDELGAYANEVLKPYYYNRKSTEQLIKEQYPNKK